MNKYIQENDDKNCHETISLGEHMALLEHCSPVQESDIDRCGWSGLQAIVSDRIDDTCFDVDIGWAC